MYAYVLIVSFIFWSKQWKHITYLKNVKTGKTAHLKVDGIFPYVGLEPNIELFGAQLKLDESGFILTDVTMKTNIDGVYAIGDVRTTPLRQVITAVSDGAIAGVEASKYLMNLKEEIIRK